MSDMQEPEQSDIRPPRKRAQEIEGIEGGAAVTVEFDEEEKPEPIKTQSGEMSLPPTTTREEDINTASQRDINRIWEFTQAGIALMITMAVIYTAVAGIESQILTSGFFLIIGFYFSRVNHQNIGGIGRKATDFPGPYRGR